jgi:hypothetical protein
VLHQALLLAACRPDVLAVLEQVARSSMREGCSILAPDEVPQPLRRDLPSALFSPHERRIRPCEALPRPAAWREATCGARFL